GYFPLGGLPWRERPVDRSRFECGEGVRHCEPTGQEYRQGTPDWEIKRHGPANTKRDKPKPAVGHVRSLAIYAVGTHADAMPRWELLDRLVEARAREQ